MWPVILHGERIELRPPRLRDKKRWNNVRAENKEWLTPWEATFPRLPEHLALEEGPAKKSSFTHMVRTIHSSARAQASYSFFIWRDQNLIGQITLGGVMFGALRGGHIGYWIDRNYANQGLMTEAVQVLTNFAFEGLGLHRIEINVRPENSASCKVAEKAGFVFEGFRPQFLHIDGQWRDHNCYVRFNSNIT
jgi:ribosomal-protein-alanine N-acetyltransferase